MSELPRRIVHASGAVIPLSHLAGVPWQWIQGFLLACCLVVAVLEVLRLAGVIDHWWIFTELTREYEQDNPAGYALYTAGMAITALVFTPFVAIPAMLMLAFGDPVSGLLSAGELGTKASWVMLAMFGVCLLCASLLAVPVVPAVLGAAAATAADGLKPVVFGYVVDDNVSIPLAGASAMWVGIHLL